MLYMTPYVFPVIAFIYDEDYMCMLLGIGQGTIM
jgi:hypothetical protein